MSEPKLYFYEVTPAGSNNAPSEVTLLNFDSNDGTAIKAGTNSRDRTIQIWNGPWNGQGLAAAPVGSIAAGATGANGYFQLSDGVADALSVDLVTRDFTVSKGTGFGQTNAVGGDVVQGTWLNVHDIGQTVTDDPEVTSLTGKQVGYLGSTERKAKLPNISSNGSVAVRLRLHVTGDAAAGERNFYIRISYSFQ
jgi:hypothetical protein